MDDGDSARRSLEGLSGGAGAAMDATAEEGHSRVHMKPGKHGCLDQAGFDLKLSVRANNKEKDW